LTWRNRIRRRFRIRISLNNKSFDFVERHKTPSCICI
jgi:hypothetical protein